jgi:hypothetical protein
MVSSVTRLVKVKGCTDRRVDQRFVGDRKFVGVPVGRSLWGVHLPSGFGKPPVKYFRRSRNRESRCPDLSEGVGAEQGLQ